MIWSQPFHQCGFVILQLIFTIFSVERTKLLQKFDGGFRIKRDEPSSPPPSSSPPTPSRLFSLAALLWLHKQSH